MATTRSDKIKWLVMRSLGQSSEEEFNRLFSKNMSTSQAELYLAYLNIAAKLYSAAHPDGWPWQHAIRTFAASDNVTHQITLGNTAPWSSTIVPIDMGFYNVMARRGDSGDYRPVAPIMKKQAYESGFANLTAAASGVSGTELPEYWWTERDGTYFYLKLAPYSFAATNELALYLPFRRELPEITGTNDAELLWPAQPISNGDMCVALLASAYCKGQIGDWLGYRGDLERAVTVIRADLRDLGIHSLGLDFERFLAAIDSHEKTP